MFSGNVTVALAPGPSDTRWSPELLRRVVAGGRVADVHLRHVSARDRPGIGDLRGHRGLSVGVDAPTDRLENANWVYDRPIPEGEQRGDVLGPVPAVADIHALAVHHSGRGPGHCAGVCAGTWLRLTGKATGSLPEGSTVPKISAAVRRAGLTPAVPVLDHPGHVAEPRHDDRTAAVDDHDRVRVGRGHVRDHRLVRSRQVERRQVALLALGEVDVDDRVGGRLARP